MSKIRTARTLLRKALGLIESGEVEWIQGALVQPDENKSTNFEFQSWDKTFYDYETNQEIPASKIHAACLMGVIDIAAARFVEPKLIDVTVQEAFDILAREIIRWEHAPDELKESYKEYVNFFMGDLEWYNERGRNQWDTEPLSFDEWQMEEFFYGEVEDHIATFNDDERTTKADALKVLRRAAGV